MTRSARRFLQLPWRSPARIQADVDEELRFELDMRAEELAAQGVPPAEARRRALAEFGDLERTRRYCADEDREAQRAERRGEWLAELRQDARLAWRGLRRTPGFAAVVLVTLALGIGANTAVFSVVRRVLLDRLPYRAPQELVRLYGGDSAATDGRGNLAPADVADLERSPLFAGVAAFGFHSGLTFVGDGGAEIWQRTAVGPEFFRVLGARPLLGRTLDARDVAPDAAPVVLLGHALWHRVFGADPGVVGRDVQLDGRGVTVVGVMPPDFVSPTFTAEAWTPLDLAERQRDPARARSQRWFGAVARLAPDATPERVRAGLAALAHRVRAEHPELQGVAPASAVPLRDAMVGQVRPALLAVMGAALLVLLIACVNVAGLFLARATARRQELTVRAALGAGRGRLVRQLLTESALVGLVGGAIGIVLAYWGRSVLVGAAASLLPSVGEARIDVGVLALAVGASLLCGLAFGALPALAGTRLELQGALAESSRGAAGGRVRARAGRILVAAQVALAVVLLVGAGLLGRTLVALERTGVGYDVGPELLTFRVNLGQDRYAEPERQVAFVDAFTTRLRALPGVHAVALTGISPWNGGTSAPIIPEGRPTPLPGAEETAGYASVSEELFATLGVPLREGRAFTAQDRAGAPPVAVISESLARRYWPSASPIGRRIRVGRGGNPTEREIVGVVADVQGDAAAEPEPTVYVPMRQQPWSGGEFVVRASGDVMALVPAIRRELRTLDPALPLVHARTMAEVFDGMVARQRLPLLFTAAFALLALLLAAIGVYGVMAYAVAARTREFGIRAALGARRGSVLALVLRQGMATALLGTAAGLALAAAATRVLATLLVGVSPHDPATFVAVPLLLLAVMALACLLPARRATRVAPLEALRE